MAMRLPAQSGMAGAALQELISEHGAGVLAQPRMLANLLSDLLPDSSSVARLLVAAETKSTRSRASG